MVTLPPRVHSPLCTNSLCHSNIVGPFDRGSKSATSEPSEEIRQLFRRYVPEIKAGTVEIVSLARAIGRRSCVAVRFHDPTVSAVQACSGDEGARLNAIAAELGGEHFTMVPWHASPEQLIADAFSHPGLRVLSNSRERQAVVTIDIIALGLFLRGMPDRLALTFEELTGLVSELTGWKISLAVAEND